jgi:mono/diheme cytochrome c family protein
MNKNRTKLISWAGGGVAALLVVVGVGRLLFQDPHVAKGKALFHYYCAHCHGDKGRGNGYNAEFLDPKPRDLTDSVEAYLGDQTNEDIYATLSRDVKEESETTEEETWVPAMMPTFKYTLSDEQRWLLVAYLRTLHANDAEPVDFSQPFSTEHAYAPAQAPAALAVLTADERRRLAEKGKHLYELKFMCFSCHQIGDNGGRVGPDLSRSGVRLNPQWVYRWIKSPQSIMKETKMVNFGMSDEEALAITAYLSTLRESPSNPALPVGTVAGEPPPSAS